MQLHRSVTTHVRYDNEQAATKRSWNIRLYDCKKHRFCIETFQYTKPMFFTTTKPNILKHIITKQFFHQHPPLRNTNTFITAPTNTQKQHKQHIYRHIQTMHFMQKQYTSNPTPDTASKHISLCRISAFFWFRQDTQNQPHPTPLWVTSQRPNYIENYQSISKNRHTN